MGFKQDSEIDFHDSIHYPWIFVDLNGEFHCFNSAAEARDHAAFVKKENEKYNSLSFWGQLWYELTYGPGGCKWRRPKSG